jgi:hypothetical protein
MNAAPIRLLMGATHSLRSADLAPQHASVHLGSHKPEPPSRSLIVACAANDEGHAGQGAVGVEDIQVEDLIFLGDDVSFAGLENRQGPDNPQIPAGNAQSSVGNRKIEKIFIWSAVIMPGAPQVPRHRRFDTPDVILSLIGTFNLLVPGFRNLESSTKPLLRCHCSYP